MPILPQRQLAKRHALLLWLRQNGEASRVALARALGLSNSRVGDLVEQMLAEGLLVEDHEGAERRGRRGVPVRLNAGYGSLLGFDMEAKRLRLVACDFAGRRVWESRMRLQSVETRQALISQILQFIGEGCAEARRQCPNVLGIGLAASGVVDVRSGTMLHYDLLEAARDIPLRDLVAAHVELPCVLEDNIRALTLAEWFNGAASQLRSFVCVAVRSGVGAGIVINNRLHTGSHGFAGEAGYMGTPFGDGLSQWKHLHEVVSEHALGVDAEEPEIALSSARARRAGELLGVQLASVATLLDPEAIVLSGTLLNPSGPLWDPMNRAFRQLVLPELAERVQLLPARLGPFAAADGAAHRCFQMLFPVDAGEH